MTSMKTTERNTAANSASTTTAGSSLLEWEFPRMGSCHEGIAFADGVTGVLVWGGGDTVNLTVGRADLWDHRGGYDWLPSQSYANIVSLVQSGRKEELLGLFTNNPPFAKYGLGVSMTSSGKAPKYEKKAEESFKWMEKYADQLDKKIMNELR